MELFRIERAKEGKNNYQYIYGYDLWENSYRVEETYGHEGCETLQWHFGMVENYTFSNNEVPDWIVDLYVNLYMWCDDYVLSEDVFREKLLEKEKVKEDSIFNFLFERYTLIWTKYNPKLKGPVSQIWIAGATTIEERKERPIKQYLDGLGLMD